MSAKGFIDCYEENGVNVYSPMIARKEAAVRETDSFLSRVYLENKQKLFSQALSSLPGQNSNII